MERIVTVHGSLYEGEVVYEDGERLAIFLTNGNKANIPVEDITERTPVGE